MATLVPAPPKPPPIFHKNLTLNLLRTYHLESLCSVSAVEYEKKNPEPHWYVVFMHIQQAVLSPLETFLTFRSALCIFIEFHLGKTVWDIE